ncbi:hypothetical protein ACRRTK_003730 [Alexandromys fortis]
MPARAARRLSLPAADVGAAAVAMRGPSMVMADGPRHLQRGPVRVGFYDIEGTLGKGNFAVVKLGRHRITKTEVCVLAPKHAFLKPHQFDYSESPQLLPFRDSCIPPPWKSARGHCGVTLPVTARSVTFVIEDTCQIMTKLADPKV